MNTCLKKVDKNDCKLLFGWANEDLVRKNSFNSNKISYEEHIQWLNNKLNSVNCLMYIFYINEIPVGQIRIDIENNRGILSYSLDKNYRGKGLAVKMLEMVEDKIYKSNMNIKELIGYVKIVNLASQKVFEKLNYYKLKENKNLKYYKYI